MNANIIAIVPAAGSGSRMMSETPKQYLRIGEKSIIDITLEKLLAVPEVSAVVVAVSEDDQWWKHTRSAKADRVYTVTGGPDRSLSVKNALSFCRKQLVNGEQPSWALVHDAARPCVSNEKIQDLIAKVASFEQDEKNQNKTVKEWHVQGAILACPVSDTVKRASQNNIVTATEDRSELWLAHTPQLFPLDYLFEAIEACHARDIPVTDEASAVENYGGRVMVVSDRRDNIKITYAEDLIWAEQILLSQ
ncbi:2-C-methyl-D-erythritol 4-phosphate cytidylyltransferase [Thalassocella blandensis]|nr:2-C-methyl-D-erythritol 4-phosphate cytidylyltransferase [Thalassocella blandensis]